MARLEREALFLMHILNYYRNVSNNDKKSAVNHFKAEQVPKSII